jgi:integrase
MASKLQSYLDKKPAKAAVKNFDQAFEFACANHPVWSLTREKNTQAENARRHHKQLQTHMEGEPIPLKAMTTKLIKDFTEDIKDELEWTDNSANKFLSTISTTFKCLLRYDLITEMPVILRYGTPEGRTEWFTQQQIDHFCQLANNHGRTELADLILFAAYTGLRQGEIRKLRAWDFDFRMEQPFIHVGGTPESRTKTNNYRQVGLNDRLLPMVHRILDGANPSDLVFGDYWFNRQRISREFNNIRGFMMYEDDTITKGHVFHTLRHSYGTWQIAAGTPVMHVKQTMGHSNVKTTERYVHNTMAAVVNCANAI